MATDDERRRVAEALRYYASSDIDGGLLPSLKDAAEVAGGTWRTLFTRLADLVEPAPKCSEAAPKCDPTERGIDSIDEWCRWNLEGSDGTEDRLFCAIMGAIDEYRNPELAAARTVRAVDRGTLLELADELDGDALWVPLVKGTYAGGYVAACGDAARRIREACGEAS